VLSDEEVFLCLLSLSEGVSGAVGSWRTSCTISVRSDGDNSSWNCSEGSSCKHCVCMCVVCVAASCSAPSMSQRPRSTPSPHSHLLCLVAKSVILLPLASRHRRKSENRKRCHWRLAGAGHEWRRRVEKRPSTASYK
jgi:hypothetical protein